jgi:hypothetical protein
MTMAPGAVSRAAAAVAVWMLLSTGASAQTDEQNFYRQQFGDWGGIARMGGESRPSGPKENAAGESPSPAAFRRKGI